MNLIKSTRILCIAFLATLVFFNPCVEVSHARIISTADAMRVKYRMCRSEVEEILGSPLSIAQCAGGRPQVLWTTWEATDGYVYVAFAFNCEPHLISDETVEQVEVERCPRWKKILSDIRTRIGI